MKERPIIFSEEMVRAILEGRKTQTRRIIKFPKVNPYIPKRIKVEKDKSIDLFELCPHGYIKIGNLKCPYGQPRDRLWVRESGWLSKGGNGFVPLFTCHPYQENLPPPSGKSDLFYKKISSIHMPHWASRITLEITNIRIEKLQKISEKDAEGEGITPYPFMATMLNKETMRFDTDKHFCRDHFEEFWDRINGKFHPWSSNPWIWVIEFRRIQ